jgi:polyisoprenoid-binding protein YceI
LTLVFKKIADKGNNVYTVYGELTIKGITQDINFDLTVNNNSASGKLIIDRTKFGIKYGSGSFFSDLGDRTIYDEFELDVTLSF